MKKTSGLVLDIYDDINGDVLRSIFPQPESIPSFVKQAGVLTDAQRGALPDEVHALVLVDEDTRLRKFACYDKGSTALAVLYFSKTAEKLPVEARQRAAENLKIACGWYGLDVPEELEKEAGLGTVITALQLPGAIANTKKSISANLAGVRAAEGPGHTVVTPNEMKGKYAELANTRDMPLTPPLPTKEKFVVKKTAEVGRLVPGHTGESGSFGPEETEKYDGYTKGKAPKGNPQVALMNPVVHVAGKDPVKKVSVKEAQYTALAGKYPLDSYADVKRASDYFSQYGHMFDVVDRREYCRNLTKRASDLGISLSKEAAYYGGEEVASISQLNRSLEARLPYLNSDMRNLAIGLFEKHAELDADLFATTLLEFDKLAGLTAFYDSAIPDPFVSVIEKVKTAADEEDWSEVIGNDYINADSLKRLAKGGHALLKAGFGEDFATEFQKDPLGIFKSMPMEQKKIIARLANDDASTFVAV